jgi:hypothetical protein
VVEARADLVVDVQFAHENRLRLTISTEVLLNPQSRRSSGRRPDGRQYNRRSNERYRVAWFKALKLITRSV